MTLLTHARPLRCPGPAARWCEASEQQTAGHVRQTAVRPAPPTWTRERVPCGKLACGRRRRHVAPNGGGIQLRHAVSGQPARRRGRCHVRAVGMRPRADLRQTYTKAEPRAPRVPKLLSGGLRDDNGGSRRRFSFCGQYPFRNQCASPGLSCAVAQNSGRIEEIAIAISDLGPQMRLDSEGL